MSTARLAILLFLIIFTFFLPATAEDYKGDIYFSKFDSSKANDKFFLTENRNFISRKYILGPNDVVDISFFGLPNLEHKNIRVQPDGTVTLALLDTVNIAGYTVEDFKNLLVEKYKFYLKDPKISINLVETKPFIVYVSGAVINPGSYELDTNTSRAQFVNNERKPELRIIRKTPLLSNVVVAAGGVEFNADLEHIIIKNNIEKVSFEVNLFEMIENGDANQDIYLMAGDVVYVPSLPTPLGVNPKKYKQFAGSTISTSTMPVRVMGYVNRPGLVHLNTSRSINLNSAIAEAGGYASNAPYAPKSVYLSRIDNNEQLVTTKVNPNKKDITLMPNDIIYVPDKARPLVGKAFDYLTRIITPANSFAASYNNWALMFDPQRYQVNVLSK